MNKLPKGHTELSKYGRPIKAIYWHDNDDSNIIVCYGSTVKIEAYDESGEMSYVPWIAVFYSKEIIERIPVRMVSVHNELND